MCLCVHMLQQNYQGHIQKNGIRGIHSQVTDEADDPQGTVFTEWCDEDEIIHMLWPSQSSDLK